MSSHRDLSAMSYKELQALAVKHQIPGNIKKLMLVKILRAVNCGNTPEVTRLLSDLKKNRKKRTKRIKISRADESSSLEMTMQDSFDFTNGKDDYSFPMQQHYHRQQPQYPFSWVRGEDEVTNSSRQDIPKRNLTYEEIRQFVFYNSHNLYNNHDPNNNSALMNEIVDLRTDATTSQHHPTMSNSFITSNHSQQHFFHSSGYDSADNKMSILLKRMLQAPVGANLKEIATPDPNWSLDARNLRESSPDDSETMTAKSDINESEEVWNDDVTATSQDFPALGFDNELNYGDDSLNRRTENATSFYESSLNNGLELSYDQRHPQYQFNMIPQADSQENCRSWLASSSLDIPTTSNFNPKIDTVHQFQNFENASVMASGPCDSSVIQRKPRFGQDEHPYLSSPLPDLQLDTSNYYRIASDVKSPEPQHFYPQVYPPLMDNPNFGHEMNNSQHQRYEHHQQKFASSLYHGEFGQNPYYLNDYQQQQSDATSRPDQTPVSATSNLLPEIQDQHAHERFAEVSSSVQSHPANHSPSMFDAYWPHWNPSDRSNMVSTTGGRSLENTLNLCTPNYVDFSKLNETCSVYSNTAPVMTLRKSSDLLPTTLESKDCIQNSDYHHSDFASSSLLFSEESERENYDQTDSVDLSTYCLDEQSDLPL
ncbi:hypothetical protein QAD02_022109 [Eretmocerus hayati]|uniref:Uncharacterized protein n=1 Tax=Eretmocerus hayati TaxID=131215 RepID=A0ACC2PSC9_9HYME|nr:hypothetical protein QAD02_022109 [Eretmocerus hayati]